MQNSVLLQALDRVLNHRKDLLILSLAVPPDRLRFLTYHHTRFNSVARRPTTKLITRILMTNLALCKVIWQLFYLSYNIAACIDGSMTPGNKYTLCSFGTNEPNKHSESVRRIDYAQKDKFQLFDGLGMERQQLRVTITQDFRRNDTFGHADSSSKDGNARQCPLAAPENITPPYGLNYINTPGCGSQTHTPTHLSLQGHQSSTYTNPKISSKT